MGEGWSDQMSLASHFMPLYHQEEEPACLKEVGQQTELGRTWDWVELVCHQVEWLWWCQQSLRQDERVEQGVEPVMTVAPPPYLLQHLLSPHGCSSLPSFSTTAAVEAAISAVAAASPPPCAGILVYLIGLFFYSTCCTVTLRTLCQVWRMVLFPTKLIIMHK